MSGSYDRGVPAGRDDRDRANGAAGFDADDDQRDEYRRDDYGRPPSRRPAAGAAGSAPPPGGYDDRVADRGSGTVGSRRAANRPPYVRPRGDDAAGSGSRAGAADPPGQGGPATRNSGSQGSGSQGSGARGDGARGNGAQGDGRRPAYDERPGGGPTAYGRPAYDDRPVGDRSRRDTRRSRPGYEDRPAPGGRAGAGGRSGETTAFVARRSVAHELGLGDGPLDLIDPIDAVGETDGLARPVPAGAGAPRGRGAPGDVPPPGAKHGGPKSKMGTRGPMWWRRRPRWLRRLVLLGLLASGCLFAALVALIYTLTKVPVPKNVLDAAQSSVITYSDGSTVIARVGTRNRTEVPLSAVSVDAQHAVLAAEDRNFYSEPGISMRGIARAMWVNLTGGGISQGGSTITQQYAKNAYLSQQRTFTRKFTEIALAVKLDRQYSKNQILEFYLNTIYFGRGAYGIEAASQTYFGVPAKNLTAEQGAVIAGLIRSPNYLDPRVSPAAAKKRWFEVMDTMVSQHWLPASRATPDKVSPTTQPKDNSNGFKVSSDQAAYIRDQVKFELAQAGISEQDVATRGLQIKTSIDVGRQNAAYQAVTSTLQKIYGRVPDLRTGLVAIEPKTGRVLAWYGGTVYGTAANGQTSYVDNVHGAAVPAGSTFKPIVLAAALEKGISLKSVYAAPPSVDIAQYHVVNDETNVDFGYVDLAGATAESLNTVYVPLGLNDVGIGAIASTAKSLGVTRPLQSQGGIILGEDPIPADQMVAVYGAFANGGMGVTTHLVDTVTDNKGKIIYRAPTESKRVMSPSADADLTYALQQVIAHGTGTAAKLAGDRPAAGKTGTTDKFRSAWFCGYTPQLASCVNMFKGSGGPVAVGRRSSAGARGGKRRPGRGLSIATALLAASGGGVSSALGEPRGLVVTLRVPARSAVTGAEPFRSRTLIGRRAKVNHRDESRGREQRAR